MAARNWAAAATVMDPSGTDMTHTSHLLSHSHVFVSAAVVLLVLLLAIALLLLECISSRHKRDAAYLFKYILLCQIVVYIEAGAIPSLLNQLKVIFDMSFNEMGALGGVVYLFLSIACPFAGYCFRHYNIRSVMAVSLTLNMCATLLFALTPDGYTKLLIGARALIGFTQAFLMVYSPVWVDEFAPASRRTSWMSYLQGAVPIGIGIGYCLSTAIGYFDACPWCDHSLICECWRWPFLVQVACSFPLVVGSYFVPEEHIDARAHLESGDDSFYRHMPKELPRGVANRLPTGFMYPSPQVVAMDSSAASATATPATADAANDSFSEQNTPAAVQHSAFQFTPTDSARAAAALGLTPAKPATVSVGVNANPLHLPSAAHGTGSGAASGSGKSRTAQLSVPAGSDKRSFASSSTLPVPASTGSGSTAATLIASNSEPPTASPALSAISDQSTYRSGGGGGCCSGLVSTITALLRLFSNRVYTYVALALSALYFVVTGVQFWGTDYLISVLGGDVHSVRILFILTSATAPIFGVVFGGWVVDRYGGYHGASQTVSALGVCIVFGVVGAGMAIPCAYFTSLYLVFAMVWVFLFCGGAVVPPATGVLISCVPPHMRAFASGVSVVFFNLLGYFLCPMASGLVMNKLGEFMPADQAFRWGFRLILFWSGWAFLFLVLAWYHAKIKLNAKLNRYKHANVCINITRYICF